MSLGLLLGVALAAPSPLCAPLLSERVDTAAARAAIAAGADPSVRCPHPVTVRVQRSLSLPEVLLGIVVPPLGVLMMMGDRSHPTTLTRSPAPLDLAIRQEHAELTQALLGVGADPLQPAPAGEPVPLVTAIAQDLRLGGTTWSARLLEHCDSVPADLLRDEATLLDALLDAPELLQALLGAGLDPEGRDGSGGTWLLRAARDADLAHTRAALALGADPNLRRDGETPLAAAVSVGALRVVSALVDAGADPSRAAGNGRSLVTRAVEQGDPPTLEAVLRLGLPADGSDGAGRAPVAAAASRGADDLVELLLARGAPATDEAVLEATKQGGVPMLRRLLAAGGDPDAEGPFGRRPLHHALEADKGELVALLLDAGADPGKRSSSWVFDEPPPIRIPMRAGDGARVSSLLPLVDAQERGWLLVSALSAGDEDMAARIVAAGVDLDAALPRLSGSGDAPGRAWLRDRGARTPPGALAEIVAFGAPAAVDEALLDGVDLDRPGGTPPRTPAEVAIERGDVAILDRLIAAGARLPAGWDVQQRIRGSDPAVLERAFGLGARAGAGAIAEARFWDAPEALEVLARHVHDPAAWRAAARRPGPLRDRVEEIHAEKRAAAVEARRARRRRRWGGADVSRP